MCGTGFLRSVTPKLPRRSGALRSARSQNAPMPATTNASRLLTSAGIDHEVRAYDLATEDFSAEAVADAIGMPWSQVFKTLVAAGAAPGRCSPSCRQGPSST